LTVNNNNKKKKKKKKKKNNNNNNTTTTYIKRYTYLCPLLFLQFYPLNFKEIHIYNNMENRYFIYEKNFIKNNT